MHDGGRAVGTDRHGSEVDWPEAIRDLREFRRIPRVSRVIKASRRAGHHPPGPEATVAIPERAPGEVLRRHARDTHSVQRHRLPPIELDGLSPGPLDPFSQAPRHDEPNPAPRELLHAPERSE